MELRLKLDEGDDDEFFFRHDYYYVKEKTFCCEDMEKMFEDFFHLHKYHGTVCLKTDHRIHRSELKDNPPAINHCPFCGTKIKALVVEIQSSSLFSGI